MTFRSLASDIFGALLVLAAFVWCGFDAAQHAGRVAGLTMAGALALATAGGWLVSKSKTLAMFDFVFTQLKRALTLKAGSDADA